MNACKADLGSHLFSKLSSIMAIFFVLLCISNSGQAQESNTPQRGFYPAGTFHSSDLETINAGNGNMMIHMPITSLPPGRGGLSAEVRLIYNSKIWNTITWSYLVLP